MLSFFFTIGTIILCVAVISLFWSLATEAYVERKWLQCGACIVLLTPTIIILLNSIMSILNY